MFFLVDYCTFSLTLVNPGLSQIRTHDDTQSSKRNDVVCVRTYLISFFVFDKVQLPFSRDFFLLWLSLPLPCFACAVPTF